jgi:tetratricopeptide (TPR) repeat protein
MNYHAGKFDEAEQQLRQSIELDKNRPFVFGTWLLGKVYVATGKYDLALQELGKAVGNSRGSSWTGACWPMPWARLASRAKRRKFWRTFRTRTNTAVAALRCFNVDMSDPPTIWQRYYNDLVTTP